MSDLEQEWALALAEAERRARVAGRGDVVDYLALRASNDLARTTAAEWLFSTFTAVFGEFNRRGASIQISRTDPHRFGTARSTMIGTLLTFRMGVRSLMVEAGWPRSPGDGIVKGGGLAEARIRHFGRRAMDEEMLLVRSSDGKPQWLVLERSGNRVPLSQRTIQHHVGVFLK